MSVVRTLGVGEAQEMNELVKGIQVFCGSGWSGESASSLMAAHKALESIRFDIVIVDVDQQEKDIIRFLETVAERWPRTLRYALTDAIERSKLIPFVESCHQVLLKSTDPASIAKNLVNAMNLREILTDESLHNRISGIKSLPCLPEMYNQLVTELRDPNVSLIRIANLISDDSAMSAKVLQVVNSAYFGLSNRVENMLHAVNTLGLDTVQSLVLSAGVFSQFQNVDIPGSSMEDLFNDGARISASSRLLGMALGLKKREIANSLLSGMLLDLGKLIMSKYFRDEFKQAVQTAQQQKIPLSMAEERLIGVDDATIGAYMLSCWGLPDSIIEAVTFHQMPSKCRQPILGTLTLVHIAWALHQDEKHKAQNRPKSAVDLDYLSALELSADLPAMRDLSAASV